MLHTATLCALRHTTPPPPPGDGTGLRDFTVDLTPATEQRCGPPLTPCTASGTGTGADAEAAVPPLPNVYPGIWWNPKEVLFWGELIVASRARVCVWEGAWQGCAGHGRGGGGGGAMAVRLDCVGSRLAPKAGVPRPA